MDGEAIEKGVVSLNRAAGADPDIEEACIAKLLESRDAQLAATRDIVEQLVQLNKTLSSTVVVHVHRNAVNPTNLN